MFKKLSLTLISMIMLASLISCGTTAVGNNNPKTTPADGQSNSSGVITDTSATYNYQMLPAISEKIANLKLDASADGSTQQLIVGEVMSINLESNPSTGYSWFAKIANSEVLVVMGEPVFQAPAQTSTPVVGAPGTETLYFQASAAGTTTLTLEYKRGWETGVTPEKTITMTVEVK